MDIKIPDEDVENWYQKFYRFNGWSATEEDFKQILQEFIVNYWNLQKDKERLEELEKLSLDYYQATITQEDIDRGYYDPKLAEDNGDLRIYEGNNGNEVETMGECSDNGDEPRVEEE